ncbi:hypothetical protein [Streptomyces sp. NPDC091212]|uniref:hypothetical protein n=1 Tax=Streptomyces sp. NPDC091212 TaxID=3155191 RepID=UPI0034286A00
MTTLFDPPVQTPNDSCGWHGRPLPAPTAPTSVTNIPEPDGEVHAVVTVRVMLSRDALAYLVREGIAYEDTSPDTWSVPFIRWTVEMQLSLAGGFTPERDVHLLFRDLDCPDGRPSVQAAYRAVDRAYPYYASTVIVSGPGSDTRVDCMVCDWSQRGEDGPVMALGLEHSEQVHQHRQ